MTGHFHTVVSCCVVRSMFFYHFGTMSHSYWKPQKPTSICHMYTQAAAPVSFCCRLGSAHTDTLSVATAIAGSKAGHEQLKLQQQKHVPFMCRKGPKPRNKKQMTKMQHNLNSKDSAQARHVATKNIGTAIFTEIIAALGSPSLRQRHRHVMRKRRMSMTRTLSALMLKAQILAATVLTWTVMIVMERHRKDVQGSNTNSIHKAFTSSHCALCL